ncbi:MAG TPA: cupredoxin domain-containing protein [Mycobacteriales bacterium]|jgi:plastocyanin|nr:cupredoxin domain-containing protein [Mycobacteriales bacterium]
MQHVRRAAAGALALATVVALGACTKQDNGNNTLADIQDTPSASNGPQSTGPAPSGGGTELVAKDNEFDPKTLTVAAGDVTISMKNTGQAPHTFTNADLKVDVNADAGKTVEVKLTGLKSGQTIKFICKYHESLGMTGELKVS